MISTVAGEVFCLEIKMRVCAWQGKLGRFSDLKIARSEIIRWWA